MALSALALHGGGQPRGGAAVAPSSVTDVALGGLRWAGPDPAVIRLNSEQGEPGPARRAHPAGLALLVALGLLVARTGLGRTPAAVIAGATSRLERWWPVLGRAPPVLLVPPG